MNENNIKHLEFIQGVINRHNSNSFMLKGWAITISAALYAIAGSLQIGFIVWISILPILLFWGLDAYYLSNERCFIDLYNAVVKGSYKIPKRTVGKNKFIENETNTETGSVAEFNMNFKTFKKWKDNNWFYVLWSTSIFWFYVPLVIATFVIATILHCNNAQPVPVEVNAIIKSTELQVKIEKESANITANVQQHSCHTDSSKKIK